MLVVASSGCLSDEVVFTVFVSTFMPFMNVIHVGVVLIVSKSGLPRSEILI